MSRYIGSLVICASGYNLSTNMIYFGSIINSYIGKNFFLTTLMPLIYFEQVCSSSTLLSSNGARCQGEGMGLVASHASSAILAICSYRLLMRQSLLFGRLMAVMVRVTVVEVVWLRYKQMRRRVTTDNSGRRARARVARCGLRTPISTKLARVNHPVVS